MSIIPRNHTLHGKVTTYRIVSPPLAAEPTNNWDMVREAAVAGRSRALRQRAKVWEIQSKPTPKLKTMWEQNIALTTYPPIYKTSEGGGAASIQTPRIFPPIYFVDASDFQESLEPPTSFSYPYYRIYTTGVDNETYVGTLEFELYAEVEGSNIVNGSLGTISASSSFGGGYEPELAIDGDMTAGWCSAQIDGPQWLMLQFPSAVTIRGYGIGSHVSNNNPAGRSFLNWVFQGSYDTAVWDTLHTGSSDTEWVFGELRKFYFNQ